MRRLLSLIFNNFLYHKNSLKLCSLGLFVILASACQTTPDAKRIERVVESSSNQRVYLYPFDSVWRSAQLTLKYPIAVNNMESGVLETEWIPALDGFLSPIEVKQPSSGIRYKITMTLTRGRAQGRESVRVNVYKKIERKRDFFSEPESLNSDGLEEQVLFYRIERELVIEDALRRAQEKGKL